MTADSDRFLPLRWGRFLSRVLVFALAFAVVAIATRLALGDDPAEAAAGGAVMTVPWTLLWIWQGWRGRRNLLRSAPTDLTREQLATALRASVRGPVPTDPTVRAEAARMARSHYAIFEGESPWTALVILGLFAAGTAVAALVYSPWFWVVAGAIALMAVQLSLARKQQEQRLNALQEPRTTETSGPSVMPPSA